MNDFFASLYEFFGLAPLYSKDLGDHLRGLDITCQGYVGSPLYIYIGISMILVTFFTYALQYHIIDSNRYNKLYHWWITSALLTIINFFIAFSIPNNDLQNQNYCNQLTNIKFIDCVGFGISNSILSFILFTLITSFKFPRKFSINCRHTTFWKP
jgi:hypothetical protein